MTGGWVSASRYAYILAPIFLDGERTISYLEFCDPCG